MATTVRELITRIGWDVDEQGIRQAEGRVNNFKRNLKLAAAAVVGGIAAIGGAALKAAADMESLEVQFETMLGSAEAARNMMAELQDFAAGTPFQLQDLARGSQNLLAFGVAADDVVDTLRMIGDTAGGNSEKLQGLVLAYGKVQTIGRASMEEIRQIAERGVPIIETLSEQLGVTNETFFEMVSAGQVGREEITQAFRTMTSEGGLFFRGMERASLTFNGLLSTLKDNLQLTAAAIGGRLLPVAKELTTTLIGLVQGALGDLIGALVSGLEPILATVGRLLMRLFEAVSPLSRILTEVFDIVAVILDELATGTLESLMPTLILMVEVLAEILQIMLPIVQVFLRFQAMQLRVMFMRIAAPLRIMLSLLRGLLRGFQPVVDAVRDLFGPLVQRMMDRFGGQIGDVAELVDRLAAAAERFGERIASAMSTAILWITNVQERWRGFVSFFETIANGIVEAAREVGDWLRLLFTNPVEAIKLAWDGVLQVFRRVWEWVIERVGALTDWISRIPGIDIRIPRLSDPVSGGSRSNVQNTVANSNNRTANVAMSNNIQITMPAGGTPGSGVTPGGGVSTEQVRSVVQQAAESVFAIELRKIFVSAGF